MRGRLNEKCNFQSVFGVYNGVQLEFAVRAVFDSEQF